MVILAKQEWLYNGLLVLPDRVAPGSVLIQEGRISDIVWGDNHFRRDSDAKFTDLNGNYIAPGFVEIHSHGAGGSDFMDNTPEAFINAAETHLRHGVTTLFPTAVAANLATEKEFLRAFKIAKTKNRGADMPGVHLEGPYLSPKQKGAMDSKHIRNPDRAEYEELLRFADGDIARWTAAPELPGALEFGDVIRACGVVPTIGHTNAEYKDIVAAYQHGFTHFTHFYSCMSTITRRNGFRMVGAIESAYILEDATVEVIADGCHLPIELLSYVVKAKGVTRVCLTGDSMRCAGTNVTESVLGPLESGIPVVIEDGVAKLMDRSAFAGSIAMADRLLRVAHLEAGIPLHSVVRMMSLTPASVMGLDKEIGSIEIGKRANFAVFDQDLNIRNVLLDGNWMKTSLTY